MFTLLSGLAGACGVAAIAADAGNRRHPSFYALKPATTGALIALAALAVPDGDYRAWILAGLLLSLAGDVSLMFDGSRAFLVGLGAFLFAHGGFIAAFVVGIPLAAPPPWTLGVLAWGVAALVVLWKPAGALRGAVLVYGVVLGAMVLAAATRHDALGSTASLVAVIGSLLFLLSDSVLGLRRFVRDFPGAQAVVLATYWLALWCLVASIRAA